MIHTQSLGTILGAYAPISMPEKNFGSQLRQVLVNSSSHVFAYATNASFYVPIL